MECLSDLGKIRCISNIEGDTDKAKYSDNGKLELYSTIVFLFVLKSYFQNFVFEISIQIFCQTSQDTNHSNYAMIFLIVIMEMKISISLVLNTKRF